MRQPTTYKSQRRDSGKVTLIELLWVTLLIGGAVAGFMVGSAHFGIWGGLLGLPLGIGFGFLVSCVIAYFLNALIRSKRTPTNKMPDDKARNA
jgi:phage shock protein PspC (stress-responsive transcriptional regulator)